MAMALRSMALTPSLGNSKRDVFGRGPTVGRRVNDRIRK